VILDDYKKRLANQQSQLQEQYDDLGALILSEEFKNLPVEQRCAICDEHDAMWDLLQVRIDVIKRLEK
jgi:hypothetical protein